MRAGRLFGFVMSVSKRGNRMMGWVVRYLAPTVVIVIGFIFVGAMVFNMEKDTTNISNAGFVIAATLAALSFSYSRALVAAWDKAGALSAGEAFLLSSLCLVMASILKYGALALNEHAFLSAFGFVMTWISIVTFMMALIAAADGADIVSTVLWKRFNGESAFGGVFVKSQGDKR